MGWELRRPAAALTTCCVDLERLLPRLHARTTALHSAGMRAACVCGRTESLWSERWGRRSLCTEGRRLLTNRRIGPPSGDFGVDVGVQTISPSSPGFHRPTRTADSARGHLTCLEYGAGDAGDIDDAVRSSGSLALPPATAAGAPSASSAAALPSRLGCRPSPCTPSRLIRRLSRSRLKLRLSVGASCGERTGGASAPPATWSSALAKAPPTAIACASALPATGAASARGESFWRNWRAMLATAATGSPTSRARNASPRCASALLCGTEPAAVADGSSPGFRVAPRPSARCAFKARPAESAGDGGTSAAGRIGSAGLVAAACWAAGIISSTKTASMSPISAASPFCVAPMSTRPAGAGPRPVARSARPTTAAPPLALSLSRQASTGTSSPTGGAGGAVPAAANTLASAAAGAPPCSGGARVAGGMSLRTAVAFPPSSPSSVGEDIAPVSAALHSRAAHRPLQRCAQLRAARKAPCLDDSVEAWVPLHGGKDVVLVPRPAHVATSTAAAEADRRKTPPRRRVPMQRYARGRAARTSGLRPRGVGLGSHRLSWRTSGLAVPAGP